MSVVNKMLSDLEKRSQATKPNANYVPSDTADNNSKTVSVLLALLLVLAILLAWLMMREQAPIEVNSGTTISKITGVDKDTQLDQQTKNDNASDVALKEPPMLNAANQANVDVVLDGESIKELVTRLSESVEKLQVIEQKNNPLQVAEINHAPKKPDPFNEPVEKAAKPTMSVASSQSSDSVIALQQEANRQLQAGDKSGAKKNLSRILAIEPRDLNARKKLASLHFGEGNTVVASELLQQGIALSPSDSAMRLMLARLLFRSDKADDSLQVLKKHPRNVIADDELLSFRAALAEKQGDYSQAISDYSQLIERQKTNARWWLGLAVSQDKKSLRQAAISSYRQAQTLNQLSEQVSTFVQQRLAVLEG